MKDDSYPDGSWFNILEAAIEQANKQRREQVDPGHLLLALMDAWSDLTRDMFAAAGVDSAAARQRLVELLSRP